MCRLLIIDDDPDITESAVDYFTPGYVVIRAHSVDEGLQKACDEHPDVILLDIRLPDHMEGFAVLSRLKRDPTTVHIPVIMYSHIADDIDRLQELTVTGVVDGADYVVARKWGWPPVEKMIRRLLHPHEPSRVIRRGRHELELGHNCVEAWINGIHKKLSPREAQVLAYLNSHRGQLCQAADVAQAVWGPQDVLDDIASVRRVVARLREKLEPERLKYIFIVTVPGHGYKLVSGDA